MCGIVGFLRIFFTVCGKLLAGSAVLKFGWIRSKGSGITEVKI